MAARRINQSMRKAKKRGDSPAGRSSSRIPSGVSAVTTVSSAFPGTAAILHYFAEPCRALGTPAPDSLTCDTNFDIHPHLLSVEQTVSDFRSLCSADLYKGLTCARCGM